MSIWFYFFTPKQGILLISPETYSRLINDESNLPDKVIPSRLNKFYNLSLDALIEYLWNVNEEEAIETFFYLSHTDHLINYFEKAENKQDNLATAILNVIFNLPEIFFYSAAFKKLANFLAEKEGQISYFTFFNTLHTLHTYSSYHINPINDEIIIKPTIEQFLLKYLPFNPVQRSLTDLFPIELFTYISQDTIKLMRSPIIEDTFLPPFEWAQVLFSIANTKYKTNFIANNINMCYLPEHSNSLKSAKEFPLFFTSKKDFSLLIENIVDKHSSPQENSVTFYDKLCRIVIQSMGISTLYAADKKAEINYEAFKKGSRVLIEILNSSDFNIANFAEESYLSKFLSLITEKLGMYTCPTEFNDSVEKLYTELYKQLITDKYVNLNVSEVFNKVNKVFFEFFLPWEKKLTNVLNSTSAISFTASHLNTVNLTNNSSLSSAHMVEVTGSNPAYSELSLELDSLQTNVSVQQRTSISRAAVYHSDDIQLKFIATKKRKAISQNTASMQESANSPPSQIFKAEAQQFEPVTKKQKGNFFT